MPVDPAIGELARTIESGQPWPRPRCPNCNSGYIRFGEPLETESGPESRSHPAWEPEWIHGTFVVCGNCENPNCQQAVQVVGDFHVDYSQSRPTDDPYTARGPSYSSFYSVAHIHPPLLLMPIPQAAPKEFREGVLRASRVLFTDTGSATTSLRTTIEHFMTSQGVGSRTFKGKFRPLPERIEEWRSSDPGHDAIAKFFDAIRWLGNAGTHEDSEIPIDEVLSGASLLDEALHRLYTGPDIDVRAQAITDTRRPRHQS